VACGLTWGFGIFIVVLQIIAFEGVDADEPTFAGGSSAVRD
jgi:hypothetical protein